MNLLFQKFNRAPTPESLTSRRILLRRRLTSDLDLHWKVPERAGGRKRNTDSQLDLCPKASIVAPALLFVPERVKPYRQGSFGVMDLAPEGWGEPSRWARREVGGVCPT